MAEVVLEVTGKTRPAPGRQALIAPTVLHPVVVGDGKVPFRLFEAVLGDSVGRQPWDILRHFFENDAIRGRKSEEESRAHPNQPLQKTGQVIKVCLVPASACSSRSDIIQAEFTFFLLALDREGVEGTAAWLM